MEKTALWQPTATITTLKQRAKIINIIRDFFYQRNILEVDTPSMSQYGVTEQHLVPFKTAFNRPATTATPLFLVTSPEYHMKRLLAAGSGPIYQMNHCFRNEEMGRYHNPEFTLLEWYRPNFTLFDLITEVSELLKLFFDYPKIELLSYQEAFQHFVKIDPLEVSHTTLVALAKQYNFVGDADADTLLEFLFGVLIEPHIGQQQPTAIYHYPATQAALAELSSDDHRVAQRFEVYFKGVELANGFKELTNATEQLQRFEQDNHKRSQCQLPTLAIDHHFLAALDAGLPECSGVALGIDRLLMLILEKQQLSDVLTFPINRA